MGEVGFNPTRVRLKLEVKTIEDGDTRLQPHKGTSETPRRLPRSSSGTSFNPTRVRLKHEFSESWTEYEASTPQGYV